jgi:cell division topological specificity factor
VLSGLLKKWFQLDSSLDSKESKSVAKSRLHFVLIHDRTGLEQEDLSQFRKEMIGVIEKYFVINEKDFGISYHRDRETTTLSINSPVVLKRTVPRKEAVATTTIGSAALDVAEAEIESPIKEAN